MIIAKDNLTTGHCTYHSLRYLLKVLVGNKTDLADARQISTDEGNILATKLDVPFVETSARTGDNVQLMFETLIRNTPRPGVDYKVFIFILWVNFFYVLSFLFLCFFYSIIAQLYVFLLSTVAN